jgi:hypothetical protein
MAHNVKIYQPTKSTMQSGRGKTKRWVLEYDLVTKRAPESMMGWIASNDTLNQVKLQFDTAEQAIAYATKMGWKFALNEPHSRTIKGRTYLDNFKYVPVTDSK